MGKCGTPGAALPLPLAARAVSSCPHLCAWAAGGGVVLGEGPRGRSPPPQLSVSEELCWMEHECPEPWVGTMGSRSV